jgi:anti-anti-sigma factor
LFSRERSAGSAPLETERVRKKWEGKMQAGLAEREGSPPAPFVVKVELETVDLSSSWDVRHQLLQALHRHGGHLAADLSSVRFMDSSGLGVLVTVLKEAREMGGTFRLINPQESIARLLRVTGMDVLFDWEPGAATPRQSSVEHPDQPELSGAARRILRIPPR